MKLPLINLPVVYHIGTMNADHRGALYSSSHEGNGLSVSLCPDAWRSIARLGGSPWQMLTNPNAMFLDLLAMPEDLVVAINNWAIDKGLLEYRDMYRAWVYQDDSDDWSYMLFDSREAAIREVVSFSEDEEEDEEFLLKCQEEQHGLPPNASSLVENTRVPVLTAKGDKRAKGFGRDLDGSEMAAMFWVEDVARKTMPGVVGVWWRETYDPEILSAPRGAIIPSCIAEFSRQEIEEGCVDDDETLLDAMPKTRLVDVTAFKSGYRFVTDCVGSTAELIDNMIHSPAVVELSYDEFIKELGQGKKTDGRRLLNKHFPDYQASGMDIAKDYHVRYHASNFDGMPCIYVVHSGIEYVFQKQDFVDAQILDTHPETNLQDDEDEDFEAEDRPALRR